MVNLHELRKNRRQGRYLAGTLLFLLAVGCVSQRPAAPLLNSDRIRDEFWSYGVDVLYADSRQRVSSLYSEHSAQKITRTFAVVEFSMPIPRQLATEHSRVVAGESIGEVFRSAGWQIEKLHLFVGDLTTSEADERIAELMNITLPPTLAGHVYSFVVSRDEVRLTYATIVEIHHPDFQTAESLQLIYGEILFDDSGRSSIEDFVSLPDQW